MKKLFVLIVMFAALFSACSSGDNTIEYLAVRLDNSNMWSVMDVKSGEIILENEFKYRPSIIASGLFYVENDEGYYDFYALDDVRKPINKEFFKEVTAFSPDGYAFAVKKGGTILLIDKTCNTVKDLGKDVLECNAFGEGGTAVFKDENGKYGIIDTQGETIIKPQYDAVCNFTKEGVAIVGTKDADDEVNYKVIDRANNVLFKFSSTDYDNFNGFSDGYMPVSVKDGNSYDVYFLDRSGNRSKRFGKANEYNLSKYAMHNDVTVYFEGESYGLKNKEGEIILRPKYDDLCFMNDGKYIAKKDGRLGIVTADDDVVLPFDYEYLVYLQGNRVLAGNGSSFSIIDYDDNDVSTDNFVDYSLGSLQSVKSNYFDARKAAQKYLDVLQDGSFYGITDSYTLRNFEYLLEFPASHYVYENTLTEHNSEKGVTFDYYFRDGMVMDEYGSFFDYEYTIGKKFNFASSITSVTVSFSLDGYAETAEEAFKDEFEKNLFNKGFKPDDKGYYVNAGGHAVGVAYHDGVVSITYSFTNYNLKELIRVPRFENQYVPFTNAQSDFVGETDNMDSVVVGY